jgi:hypothetical protein
MDFNFYSYIISCGFSMENIIGINDDIEDFMQKLDDTKKDTPESGKSFWEANSETDDSNEDAESVTDGAAGQETKSDIETGNMSKSSRSFRAERYEPNRKTWEEEFNDIRVLTTKNNPIYNELVNNQNKQGTYRKLTYEDIKKKMSSHYEQSIVHKYSSAVDILTCYVKWYCFLFHEASEHCQGQLNQLMLPCIFVSSGCSVLAGIGSDKWSTLGLVVAIANAFVSFILALINFLKLDARSEAHTISVFQYNKVKGYLEFTSCEILLFQNPLLLNNGVMEAINEWVEMNKKLYYSDRDEFYEQKFQKIQMVYEEKRELERLLVSNVQKKIDEVKKMMKDIKDSNRFIIPKQIIDDYSIIYNINIFTFLKNIDNYKMSILTNLKNIRNEIRYLLNKDLTTTDISKNEKERIKELYKMKNNVVRELLALNNGYGMLDTMFQQVIKNAQLKKQYFLHFWLARLTGMQSWIPSEYKDPYDCGIVCSDGQSLLKRLL